MTATARRIVRLDTYEPEETDILTIYLAALDIRQATLDEPHHVWAITSLGRELRITEYGYPTREAAIAHAAHLVVGVRAHLEACFAREFNLDLIENRELN
ncbi:hypothetical protein [Deinococcus yavapaiensis]|uniref:Uncharacterized protein n=1 Tax=Deinococcus yavapaiensis KR-236 TaxID=694435 RepID=A0A318S7S5_9DEIO|nr:hypothetical protein [Deinococcus yavapaiensis]PYE51821.1 hypothetical protein DES52_11421 [Deinococcus yavapaiensis KR-236]